MKTKLLEWLRCPACGGTLTATAARSEQAEIMEGRLDCAGCKAQYPVRRGVPRMIAGPLPPEKQETAAGFGYSWTAYADLDDAYEQQFLDWLRPVDRSFFQGKLVLDAGCGKGRHAFWAQKFGAAEVVGVDLSDAVDVAFANTRGLPNVHIVQADIYQLPLAPVFDYAYSVGVLHHLPDPKAGFLAVTKLLKRGGAISAWVYGAENNEWITRFVDPVRKRVTSKLPRPLLHAASSAIATAVLNPAAKLVYAPANRRAPRLAARLFYNDYLAYISQFSRREIESIVFDHLVAPTAFYIPRADFARWFADARLGDVAIEWHNRNSWRGFGRVI